MDLPEYYKEATKDHVVITVSDFRGEKDLKVTPEDVVYYYATDARNITSGCRTLAGHTGDWRPIDNLAQEVLDYFKEVNREALEEAGAEYGMTLRQ